MVAHQTVMFDVHDAKVRALLSDSSSKIPTYSEWIDVPGISEVGLDPNFVTAELKGDARVIAKKGRIDRLNFSGTYAKLDLDVQAVLLGSTVSDLTAQAAVVVEGAAITTGTKVITGTAGDFPVAVLNRPVTGSVVGIPAGTIIVDRASDGSTATMSQASTATVADIDVTVGAVGAKARSRIQAPASLPYFGLAFKIEDLDPGIGDLHVICHKAQITGGTLIGGSSDNFGQPSFDAEAIGIDGHLPDGAGGFDDNVLVDTELLAAVTAIG